VVYNDEELEAKLIGWRVGRDDGSWIQQDIRKHLLAKKDSDIRFL